MKINQVILIKILKGLDFLIMKKAEAPNPTIENIIVTVKYNTNTVFIVGIISSTLLVLSSISVTEESMVDLKSKIASLPSSKASLKL